MLLVHRLLFILSLISTVSLFCLYFYPILDGCGFPPQDASFPTQATVSNWFTRVFRRGRFVDAPFRLLALGDPQLEGDSSLPNATEGYFPTLRNLPSELRSAHGFAQTLTTVRNATKEFLLHEVPAQLQGWRKQVDLFGNDYYLAHIYRTLHRHTRPTHVTVLGDLLGSQWIDDEEFERRGWRFWHRVVRHGRKVEEHIMNQPTQEILGKDLDWARRVINVAGNHDVGYAGDLTAKRMERFDRIFGKANWEITFQLAPQNSSSCEGSESVPELHIIVLNSMNLDTPAISTDLQSQTYNFINDVISRSRPVEDRTTGTIVLTHIPLHKEDGICADGPFFDFHGPEDGSGVKEQNHISYNAGKGILEGIYGMSGSASAPAYGMGRHGIILTGHDHEGCDVYHHLPADEDSAARRWNATRWADAAPLLAQSIPGIREITVRSMMGDFGGNAGLLSAWFDYEVGEWRFAYSTCAVGVQHIWWAIHVLALVTVGLGVFVLSRLALDTRAASVKHLQKGSADTALATKAGRVGKKENGSIRKRRR